MPEKPSGPRAFIPPRSKAAALTSSART
ncbi:uncharacterized protein G2W53_010439 [Senna tora]|uniref:Uncharacterized protein n=1 Tax=Senna tora TaxID=362788 RepID=A0A834WZ97_9FABA|nr:uncharacterized protein G2W53_010439 [Senna tora]